MVFFSAEGGGAPTYPNNMHATWAPREPNCLCAWAFAARGKALIQQAGGVACIRAGMAAHPDDEKVQEYGMAALAVLGV